MDGEWLQDLESLEAILQDETTRALFLRMAHMSRSGSLQPFLHELDADRELDPMTKLTVAELAQDASFLYAVEDYVRRTRSLH